MQLEMQSWKPAERVDPMEDVTRWMMGAENELAAYRAAVLRLHGAEAMEWAVQDWMRGLETMPWPPCEDELCWRKLTIASASRLATHMVEEAMLPARVN